MHVREAGTGRPVLLLHGWACHGGFFAPQWEGLATDARLVAPDLPGHGRTGDAGGGLSIEAAADACAALLIDRDLSGVVLVGWSMGAAVAWSLIDRHGPDRLAGLVVIDMTPRVLNDDGWRLGIRDGFDRDRNPRAVAAMTEDWPRYAGYVARVIFAEGTAVDAGLAAWVRREMEQADPSALVPIWQSLVGQDFRRLLPRIGLPALIVRGEGSRLYSADVAEWQAAKMPHARIVAFDRSGHAPHLEQPDAFNTALRSFIRPR